MKKHLVKWVYMLLAIVLTVVLIFFAQAKIETPTIDMSIFSSKGDFHAIHANELKVDSFVQLATKAYGELISIDKGGSVLKMELKNTNQLASDYYNNNDKLLNFTLENQPFEIKINKETGSVIAQYTIKDKAVTVPNDVIVKMMYKVYNK